MSEFEITEITHANPDNGNTGKIELTNYVKVWFGDNFPYKTEKEAMKAAELIRKAPEMLEMLERTVNFFDEGGSTYSTVSKFLNEIKSLIQDATTI